MLGPLPDAGCSRSHTGSTYACFSQLGHAFTVIRTVILLQTEQSGKLQCSYITIAQYSLQKILSNSTTARCTASGMETGFLFQ